MRSCQNQDSEHDVGSIALVSPGELKEETGLYSMILFAHGHSSKAARPVRTRMADRQQVGSSNDTEQKA